MDTFLNFSEISFQKVSPWIRALGRWLPLMQGCGTCRQLPIRTSYSADGSYLVWG